MNYCLKHKIFVPFKKVKSVCKRRQCFHLRADINFIVYGKRVVFRYKKPGQRCC